MKKTLIYSVLAVLAISSCQFEQEFLFQEGSEESTQKESKIFTATIEDEFEGDTKTSLDGAGNVLWKQGDQVSIFAGSTINEQYQVTDASDGKTAASLNKVGGPGFVAGTDIDNNVAFYPYASTAAIAKSGSNYVISDITLPATQSYAAGSFGNGAFPMATVTSSSSDYNLRFKNVLGGLKLQLKGTATITSITVTGNNNEILCGDAEITVSNGSTPSITLTDASAKTINLDCGGGVMLNTETETSFILALPPITMTGGFTVVVTDTEGKQMEISTSKSQTITRSGLLKMPVVNYVGTPVLSVLSETESANCYIINSPGYYAIKATKGNSDESVGDVKGVKVLWESRGTSIAPSKGEYISSVSFENELIYFRTNDAFKNGNAVIAAYSDNACSDGNVLWSWHIWFTDTPLKQIYYNYSGYVMDRNLGAINDKSVGLMYQWGRKDPFMGAISTTSNTLAKATPSFASAMKTTSLVGTIDYAIAHPTTFLLSNDSLNDWIYYGTSTNTPDHTRWAQTKTIYDPCPIGWHIPPSTLWEKASGGTEHYGYIPWLSPSAHKYDLGNDDTIWYPTAGAIRNNDGGLYNVGSWGGTWSYTKYVPGNPLAGPNYLSKNFAYWVTDSQAWGLANSAHATGYPVRCVTDIEEDPTAVKSVYLVSSISLGVGDTYQLNPSVSPYSATDKSIVFNSTNTSVATISSDGLISAVASGQCRIIATAASGKAAATNLTIN